MQRGELVAIPTETVYGLAAHALDADAVARVFAAKARPAWNPLIVHVPDEASARSLCAEWPDVAAHLARAFWPGPLTLVLRKAAHVPDIVTAGGPTVAVRVPAHPVALALLAAAGFPIAAPSANRFTQLSPTTAQHVVDALGEHAPMILDGGPCAVGIESTVLDLTVDPPMVLRPGHLSRDELARTLGREVRVRLANVTTAEAHRSPGLSERHYAPRADVWLVDPSEREQVQRSVDDLPAGSEHRVGLLSIGHGLTLEGVQHRRTLPDAPAAYAQALYAALHTLDAVGCTLIVVERPPQTAAWEAVNDRLRRSTR